MNFPIDVLLPKLYQTLGEHCCVVLQAAPGAGKTTRVPLHLLNSPWLGGRKIIMLEPRRLAARSAAQFMAKSLGEVEGETVGYRVRMDVKVGPKTRIEVVTEGVLTRILQDDPELSGVGLVIFDEFHERNLQGDLGLALCLESQEALREDLRILVMSATLDGEAVSTLLNDAPILSSEGRSFPVDIRYLPARSRDPKSSAMDAVVPTVLKALAEETGSLLVFLPGMGEIKRVEKQLRQSITDASVLLAPLYGNLSQQAQDQAISASPAGTRKVVLATNIAETSLTIEGIRIVIDSGVMRVPRFDPASGMTRLNTLSVSQASADQRCGRAGRLEAGVCYRLWNEDKHLLAHGEPEIKEADLAPLMLELAQWGCVDPAELRWLNPPPVGNVGQARQLLQQIQALDDRGRIRPHGQQMAALGMHPRLAHMVIKAQHLGLGALACDIAAVLSERDVLQRYVVDTDLHSRLLVLSGDRHPDIDRGALHRVREAAKQWRQRLKIKDSVHHEQLHQAGILLAFAYPDRIARRRDGADSRYLLANGRGATFRQADALTASDFIVVAQLDGADKEARIFLAAELAESALLAHFSDAIEEGAFIRWDVREQAVQARQQRRLGAIIFSDQKLASFDPAQAVAAMLDGVRAMGLACLPWTKADRQWQSRVQCLHRVNAHEWPDVSDARLLERIDAWLAPFLNGITRRSHLSKLDLRNALLSLLPWDKQRQLDDLVPTHLTVPTGSHIALDYDNDPPILAVRMQELFGAADTPTIAGGKIKVLLHLLSPARRPLQVTQDLAGFWGGSYTEVKKEMKGRYPKHYWPDDPLQAEPTRRVKSRR